MYAFVVVGSTISVPPPNITKAARNILCYGIGDGAKLRSGSAISRTSFESARAAGVLMASTEDASLGSKRLNPKLRDYSTGR